MRCRGPSVKKVSSTLVLTMVSHPRHRPCVDISLAVRPLRQVCYLASLHATHGALALVGGRPRGTRPALPRHPRH
jgi:hypothetical protein